MHDGFSIYVYFALTRILIEATHHVYVNEWWYIAREYTCTCINLHILMFIDIL